MSVEHGIKVYKKTHYKTTIGDHELGEEGKYVMIEILIRRKK